MPIEFSCPSCRQMVRTPDAAAGKKGKCPQCRAVVQIPAAPAPDKVPPRSTPPAPPSARHAHERLTPSAAALAGIEFFCVECGQLVRTPAAAAGKKGKCPHCRAVIDIPRKRESGGRSQGSEVRGRKPESTQQNQIDDDDLVELPELTPIDGELEPLTPDPFGNYASRSRALPQLPSLIDEVLPTLAPPPTGSGGLPAGSPFAPGSRPRRIISEVGRSGLPWEREPSTDSFFETLRLVISAPQEAFERMRRTGGIGNPFGYLIFSSVLTHFLASVFTLLIDLIWRLTFWAFSEKGQAFTIRWDNMFLFFGGTTCALIIAALFLGTIGGLLNAAMYHLSLLACGGARNGFQATYRAMAFGDGSIYMLFAVPPVGLLFVPILHFVVLTNGFKQAHGITTGRAFLAVILPTLLGGCCAGGVLLLYVPMFVSVMKEAYGN